MVAGSRIATDYCLCFLFWLADENIRESGSYRAESVCRFFVVIVEVFTILFTFQNNLRLNDGIIDNLSIFVALNLWSLVIRR